MIHQYPNLAIQYAKDKLYAHGQRIPQKTWQSVPSPGDTWELLNHHLGFQISSDIPTLIESVKPQLPWAEDHFIERISGIPANPGEQYKNWPGFKTGKEDEFKPGGKFSHTYMERFWPRLAGEPNPDLPNEFPTSMKGIRFDYGDFMDAMILLRRDPTTRQAFLPIWFPEDLKAAAEGQRVPCTLGYHFIIRNGMMHINYFIRSCDALRHMRNDIYMACRLFFHIKQIMVGGVADYDTEQSKKFWEDLRPGALNMYITSLHVFYDEREILKNQKS